MSTQVSRRNVLQLALAGAATLTITPLLASCAAGANGGAAGSTLTQLRETGVMKVAYSIDPPYSMTTTGGKLTGMAVDIVAEVMKSLGVPELEGVMVGYSDLIPGLKAKRFDTVGGSMFITPARCQEVVFTRPFAIAEEMMTTAVGNPHGIENFESFAKNDNLRLGVIGGSSELEYAKAAGVNPDSIITFQDLGTAVEAAGQGRVDSVVYDAVGLSYTVETTNVTLETTSPFTAYVDGQPRFGALAYAFRNEDQELVEAFAEAQDKLVDSGRVAEICREYVGDTLDKAIEQARTLNVDDLCGV